MFDPTFCDVAKKGKSFRGARAGNRNRRLAYGAEIGHENKKVFPRQLP